MNLFKKGRTYAYDTNLSAGYLGGDSAAMILGWILIGLCFIGYFVYVVVSSFEIWCPDQPKSWNSTQRADGNHTISGEPCVWYWKDAVAFNIGTGLLCIVTFFCYEARAYHLFYGNNIQAHNNLIVGVFLTGVEGLTFAFCGILSQAVAESLGKTVAGDPFVLIGAAVLGLECIYLARSLYILDRSRADFVLLFSLLYETPPPTFRLTEHHMGWHRAPFVTMCSRHPSVVLSVR